jgi:Nidogen-like
MREFNIFTTLILSCLLKTVNQYFFDLMNPMTTLNKQLKLFKTPIKNSSYLSTKIAGVAITSLVMGTAMADTALAATFRTRFNSNILALNDDGSSAATALGFTANFYGTNYDNTYVNNNGNVTFTGPLDTFTPFGLVGASTPIIAAFFADVDTRAIGTVTYGQGEVAGRRAFGVNYNNVGYYSQRNDKTNSFQIVLIDRPDTVVAGDPLGNFDIEFNYGQIQWETGTDSGGVNGLGGDSARAGYSNGTTTPGASFELPGSAINGAFLDGGSKSLVANSLNSDGVLGRYVFSARNGAVVVTPPNPTAAPEPFTIIGTLLGGAAAFRMKKRLKVTNKL